MPDFPQPKKITALLHCSLLSCLFAFDSGQVSAGEVLIYGGGGKQPHTDTQENTVVGADINFFHHNHSVRQEWIIGAGVSSIETNSDEYQQLETFSIYPQINLYLPETREYKLYFFVRTLAPTYISQKQLGERQQAYHFAIQSQVGAGLYFGDKKQWLTNLSYRHFSNANSGQPNDGIDALVLWTLGRKF